MSKLNNILLIGGTGGLGRVLSLTLAKHRSHFKRIAVLHDTSRPTTSSKAAILNQYQQSGLEILPANGYDSPSTYTGFDCVIILLGNMALHLQPTIVSAAIEGGVRHFYPSEFGADLLVGENWNQRYYKYKTITRDFLESKGKEISDLGWTYFLLGRLTEWSVISHFGFDNANAAARIYGTSEGRQSLIGVGDAAEYVVATLRDPLTNNHRRTFRISGESPTYGQIFDALDRITGKSYEVTYLPVDSALEEEARAKEKGDVEAELAASHKLVQGREGTLLPQPWDNERFPKIRPVGFEEALRAAFQNENWRKVYFAEGH